jgi:hypothetical protein
MPKFRKKPEAVEAFQFTQEMAEAYLFDKVPLPNGLSMEAASYHPIDRVIYMFSAGVKTREGFMGVDVGDWIVKDAGGLYVCEPDFFEATYELVD